MGKPLTGGPANRLSDQELIDVIAEGRAGTGMVAWEGSLSEVEIFDIASYIRNLQGKPALNLGDDDAGMSDDPLVLAGEQLFNGAADCATCHSYDDKGGNVGPALDGLGSRLSADALMEASQKLGEKVYAEQQAQQAEPQGEKTVDAEVVDAEFEEVKDDKK